MRILVINEKIPYPMISGAPLRTCNLLQRVAREHELWLVSFVEDNEETEGVLHLQQFCEAVETAIAPQNSALAQPVDWLCYLLSGKPPDLRFNNSQELASKIRDIASTVDFDVIHIEHGSMGLYLEVFPHNMRERTVWMLHDIDWSKYAQMSLLDWKQTRKLRMWLHSRMMRWWKPKYAERFERCITVSEPDRRLLIEANPHLQVDVVPNGIDTQLYQILPEENTSPSLVFVGNMEYLPCADAVINFCKEVFPLIRSVIADVHMWIVGLNPGSEVRRLDGDGVHVTGQVDDVRPYYRRSTACVVPLRAGSGSRLKILEAMALGRPVVSTTIGCEGLNVLDGKHLLIADDSEQFAEKTVRLLKDRTLRESITRNARKLVITHYDWDVIAKKLMRVYAEVAK